MSQRGYSRPTATTVRCGQRPPHFLGNKVAIYGLRPSQFVVAEGHNIFEVTERLFTVECHHRLLWLKAANSLSVTSKMLWSSATTNCGGHKWSSDFYFSTKVANLATLREHQTMKYMVRTHAWTREQQSHVLTWWLVSMNWGWSGSPATAADARTHKHTSQLQQKLWRHVCDDTNILNIEESCPRDVLCRPLIA